MVDLIGADLHVERAMRVDCLLDIDSTRVGLNADDEEAIANVDDVKPCLARKRISGSESAKSNDSVIDLRIKTKSPLSELNIRRLLMSSSVRSTARIRSHKATRVMDCMGDTVI